MLLSFNVNSYHANGLARDMQDGIGLVRVLLQIGDGLCCWQDDQFDLPTPGLELHLFHYR
ncbi:hypothetical protein LMG28138_03014 [Pararobbsia alpina]|uniref:Uncharacterized protein n=1 Tax=Pararobbsia alpina TaxID=621374 RepID=A0A6S7BMU0_9BURK|nr:hypothetical protein LMG28138_03014 [Pararobbsia alpina]